MVLNAEEKYRARKEARECCGGGDNWESLATLR